MVLALLASCRPQEARVDAAQYDAYWLWAGVTPQPVLQKAKTIYILEGEVRGTRSARLISLRPATPTVRHAEIWIVYRVETLNWGEGIIERINGDIARWRAAGSRVVGVQIDFDAATKGLDHYSAFLRNVRSRLPDDARLGVTGLLDWSSQGDSADLNRLGAIVDEIVLQTYQGRQTIPGYAKYLKSLGRLDMPFKIGLVQGGEWTAPPSFSSDPDFKGYVVFLLNPAK
ncbi:MAG: DUF3142 domain-containing protein [Sphingomonadaceae bacterium]|nr:DUF3142 domain-containing protein [Sphingomonadaceae bacterium]